MILEYRSEDHGSPQGGIHDADILRRMGGGENIPQFAFGMDPVQDQILNDRHFEAFRHAVGP